MRAKLVRFVGIAAVLFSPTIAAADNALSKVPADVETYGSWLRFGETVETIGNSRAWKKLWDDPSIQELRKNFQQKFNDGEGDWGPIKKFLDEPANKEIPDLIADAFSHEIFFYAGDGIGDTLALAQELLGSARFGPVLQQIFQGKLDQADQQRTRVRMVLQTLLEKPARLKIPDLVIGMKVSDPKKVNEQLKRLDSLLADALKDTPLKGRSERAKIGGDEFLVLKLDGSLIPWEMVPLGMVEDKEGEFAPLIKHLKAMKLTVALGVRQGYLLLGIGESVERLARFGGDGPKLADRDELKPLAKFADKPLTAVSYTSEKLLKAVATRPEDVIGFAELVKLMLEKAELPEKQQKAIEKDVEAFFKEYAKGIKPPGASFSFSFRTIQGWETFAYNYTEPGSKPSKPLALLNHLGGDPLIATVWRSGTTVEDYQNFVKWIGIFGGHAERAIIEKGPAEVQEYVEKYRKEFLPLIREFSDVTEKLWIPSLDGEEAFVLDAKWTSKQWITLLPETDRALPLPEIGIIVGLQDGAKFKQALEGYRLVVNKMIAKVRELAPPGSVPDFEIPKPETEAREGRATAYYPIPEHWGIDPRFQPTGGMTNKAAVLAMSKGHAERLLFPTPLKVDSNPLKDVKRPLDSAFYFNWSGIVDTIAVWLDYGISKGLFEAAGEKKEEREQMTRAVIQFLKVFRGYASVTYREGKATITHSEAIFRDLESVPKK